MTDDITIPPAALEAAARERWKMLKGQLGPAFPRLAWEALSAQKRAELLVEERAACIAMLRAWPGMHKGHQCTGCGGDPQIILPLPQDASDLVKTSQAYRSHKASFDPNVMLRQASWDGDGKDVACLTCYTELTVHNIASVDEDGNARCKRCMS